MVESIVRFGVFDFGGQGKTIILGTTASEDHVIKWQPLYQCFILTENA
ncbi:unnamed protein product, partial [marine sediment metagenome]